MSFFNEYPYRNLTDLNLDYLLRQIKYLTQQITDFVNINSIKYADPIQWNITKQYEKNTVVIDSNTGTAYLSVQPVPNGIALTNTDYWTVIFTLDVLNANHNITAHDAGANPTATFTSDVGDWLLWNSALYKVTRPIVLHEAYHVGYNLTETTVDDFVHEYVTTLANKIGELADLDTTNKTDLVKAINEVLTTIGTVAGDLTGLNTTDKSNLVSAINEVLSTIGTVAGNLTGLNTTDKSNLVGAINEVVSSITSITNKIGNVSLKTQSNDLSGALNELYDDGLAITYLKSECRPIADGSTHPLSERYNRLSEAQVRYPFASSLNDEIDYCALQKYITYCQANNLTISIPEGIYMLNKRLEMVLDDGLVNIIGEGFNTQLKATSGTGILHIIGNKTHLYNGNISNIYFNGNSQNGTGLSVEYVSLLSLNNIIIAGCDNGMVIHYCDHFTLFGCRFTWNKRGFYGYSDDYTTYTAINNISFFGCTFGNNANNGATLWRTSGCGFYNCDIEYNGSGTRSSSMRYEGGICVTDCGGQGATGLTVDGCYIEGNAGYGSIIIDQQFNPQPAIFNINSSCFTYTESKSNVLADIYTFANGSVQSIINETGCASRQYVANKLPAGYVFCYPSTSTAYYTLNRTNNFDIGLRV